MAITVVQLRTALEGIIEGFTPTDKTEQPFKAADDKTRPATSGVFRRFQIDTLSTQRGPLAQGQGAQHMIASLRLAVDYPESMRDVREIIANDELTLRTRLTDPSFLGWPDSGIFNVDVAQATQTTADGKRTLALPLRAQFFAPATN